MDDAELKRLEELSDEPFRCPRKDCPDYMTEPYCNNHSHVRCPQYEHESAIEKFLEYYDAYGMYKGGKK